MCALRAHHTNVSAVASGPAPRHVNTTDAPGLAHETAMSSINGGHDRAGIIFFFGAEVFLEFRRDAFTRWTRHDDGGIDEFVDVRVGINGSRLTDVTIIP